MDRMQGEAARRLAETFRTMAEIREKAYARAALAELTGQRKWKREPPPVAHRGRVTERIG